MPRIVPLLSLSLAALLAIAAPAAAQGLSERHAGHRRARPRPCISRSTASRRGLDGRLPTALELTAPGFETNLKALAKRCREQAAKLNECPRKSRMGKGFLLVEVTAPDGIRDVNIPINVYLHSKSSDPRRGVRVRLARRARRPSARDGGITIDFDPLPAGPPFEGVTYRLKRIAFDFGAKRTIKQRKVRRVNGERRVRVVKKRVDLITNPRRLRRRVGVDDVAPVPGRRRRAAGHADGVHAGMSTVSQPAAARRRTRRGPCPTSSSTSGSTAARTPCYYLRKGYRVVAFEAHPDLVDAGRERFAAEIADGRLQLVAGADHGGAGATRSRSTRTRACRPGGRPSRTGPTRNETMGESVPVTVPRGGLRRLPARARRAPLPQDRHRGRRHALPRGPRRRRAGRAPALRVDRGRVGVLARRRAPVRPPAAARLRPLRDRAAGRTSADGCAPSPRVTASGSPTATRWIRPDRSERTSR